MTKAASNNNNKDLQLVPETLLKKRHNLDEIAARRLAHRKKQNNNKVFSKTNKFLKVQKPETFLANAISRRNNAIRFRRVAKKGMQKRASNQPVMVTKIIGDDDNDDNKNVTKVRLQTNSVGAKMVFCIRIRDHSGCPAQVRSILNKFRMRTQYTGVFLQYTPQMRKTLQLVEPWVVYGTPTPGVVHDLISRRGHGYIKKERVPLSDNTIVEKALGDDTGIICVEDLVHELCEGGEFFPQATRFLWPFQLSAPKTEFEKQKLGEKEGKVYGDRGQDMDEIIKEMS